jgi:hypothetical protein
MQVNAEKKKLGEGYKMGAPKKSKQCDRLNIYDTFFFG